MKIALAIYGVGMVLTYLYLTRKLEYAGKPGVRRALSLGSAVVFWPLVWLVFMFTERPMP
jgi:hypothetical protein